MQSLKSVDNYTASDFSLSVSVLNLLTHPAKQMTIFLFTQLVKTSDIQGTVDTLFPEVILCVEIYNSRKSKVTALFSTSLIHCNILFFFLRNQRLLQPM